MRTYEIAVDESSRPLYEDDVMFKVQQAWEIRTWRVTLRGVPDLKLLSMSLP